MKKLMVLLLVAVVFVACKNEPEIDYALISGQIENPVDGTVNIYKGKEKISEINLDENNAFADTLRVDRGYYTFVHGRENASVYLAPGYELGLTLDTKEFDESISFTGPGAEVNNYLAAKYLTDENMSGSVSEVFAMEEQAFLEKVNALKDAKVKLLDDAQNIDDEFMVLESKNLEFEHLTNLQQYPSYHEYFAKKDDFKASDDFLKLLDGVDFTNAEYYQSLSNYKRLVQNHYSMTLRESDHPAEIFEVLKTSASEALKTDLARMLNYEVGPNNEHNEAYYNGIMAMSSDEELKAKLTRKYEKVKLLAKGMPSPVFENYENHKGGEMSLTDLKGKYVYVDVWATWCGPCKREIPYLKEVEAKYHNNNIEFVSTSIDKAKDHSAWVEMVKDKELGGIQLFADNDWNSKFVTDYAIEGIPRFLLIDPEGNIVTADAPRPSDPKLVKLFEELKL
ncbi:MAG: TlpA family protein disulfide reductase [Flavobacteriaceae bacterium]|nr:TlpA family protein disulfide reductase [Flavobacteriaceae bacterium]